MVIAPEEDEDHALMPLKKIAVTGEREREREQLHSDFVEISSHKDC